MKWFIYNLFYSMYVVLRSTKNDIYTHILRINFYYILCIMYQRVYHTETKLCHILSTVSFIILLKMNKKQIRRVIQLCFHFS
uniref:Uncharacterized protein n=1 Tax=Lepeophtheirus salmonis TaxID=72036 RepID=A0A0K2U9L2_LEPSM